MHAASSMLGLVTQNQVRRRGVQAQPKPTAHIPSHMRSKMPFGLSTCSHKDIGAQYNSPNLRNVNSTRFGSARTAEPYWQSMRSMSGQAKLDLMIQFGRAVSRFFRENRQQLYQVGAAQDPNNSCGGMRTPKQEPQKGYPTACYSMFGIQKQAHTCMCFFIYSIRVYLYACAPVVCN